MAEAERIRRHPVTVREELEIDHAAYEKTRAARFVEVCTVYTGTIEDLIALGVATRDQFPAGERGSKSGGCKDYKRNPSQRWSVRRHHRQDEQDIFDVYRWHAPRPVESGFQRFMHQAMQPAA